MISRDEWLAQPPNTDLAELKLPVSRVIITHTATESCVTQAACTLRVRLIQTYHMESKSWDDIGYNWLVGGDGSVYEGRGWDKQGAHTKGYNSGSVGIAYIGTFNKIVPNERQLQAGFLLMKEGVKLKKLTEDYKIYAHRQLLASESPGAAFFETIKTWPQWRNDTPEVFD
jgi:peptidoglycan recognition protein LC